jgi:signal transduction histidine kinase
MSSTAKPVDAPQEATLEPLRPLALQAGQAAALVVLYVALDWASYIYPLGPFNITPWSPPPALAIVAMLLGGLRLAPVVFVSAFLADILIRGAPGGLAVSAVTSAVVTLGYAGMAYALRRVLPAREPLCDTHHLFMLVSITAIGSAVLAAVYCGALIAGNYLEPGAFVSAAFRSWLGDIVGILVTAPLLLVVAEPGERVRLLRALGKPETFLQVAIMVAVVTVIFRSEGDSPNYHFYVLFLPLIWMALRSGLVGATLGSGVVQLGVVLGVQLAEMRAIEVLELQARVAALTLTGLFLGVMVDERERATEGLKRSMRLAAAGEMAGAIAHEINQPLAALRNYCKSCLLIIDKRDLEGRDAALQDVVGKMVSESRRAADVVVRLRDFFRSGTTRLENVPLATLLEGIRRVADNGIPRGEARVSIESFTDATLLVDPLQIELVFRNLLANAYEAVQPLPVQERTISVSALPLPEARVLFRVTDSGPGVPRATRERLFEPLTSNKASGMGLGLAISRTIAEAHGGTLAAPASDHGEFHLVLPTVAFHD